MRDEPQRREERPWPAAQLQTESYDDAKYSPQATGQRKRAARRLYLLLAMNGRAA